jgi:23S rRNA pseudouridine1911/1915/1917 synthase
MDVISQKAGRLDSVLSEALGLPRNQIEKLIKTVGVHVEGILTYKNSLKLIGGETIAYTFVEASPSQTVYPVSFDVPILYEDEHLLVVNKPPFLTVHGAPSVKEATLVDWLHVKGISLSTLSGEERHGIVHRIDKETSGALVVAKSNAVHTALSSQLEDKSMGRYYLAIIDVPLKEDMVIELPIGRNPNHRLKMAITQEGRSAKSAFCKLATSKDGKKELIAIKLFTGRTHQIRVHLGALSRHILGDSLYGFKSQNGTIPRVMLHAYEVYLNHPHTDMPLSVHAPLWDDFEATLAHLFSKESYDEKIKPDCIRRCFDTVDQWVRKDT